jgi:hypothetical protein
MRREKGEDWEEQGLGHRTGKRKEGSGQLQGGLVIWRVLGEQEEGNLLIK